MKSKVIMLNSVRFCVVTLLISTSFAAAEGAEDNTAGEFRPVDPNHIPEILTMISEQVRSNYDGIKTWQGEANVTSDFIHEGAKAEQLFRDRTNGTGEIPIAVIEHFESRLQFAVDIERDFLCSNLYREIPPAYTDLESGRNLGAKLPRSWYTSLIITPEYFISSMPYTYDRGNSITSRGAIKEIHPKGSPCTSNMPPAFDPRENFTNGGLVWETFPRILQCINKHGKYSFDGHDLKVEESISENIAKYRVEVPRKVSSEIYHFFTKVFSSEVGFNMTLYEVTNEYGKILYEWKWDYDLIDSIYLPKVVSQKNFTRGGGRLRYEGRSTFKNQKVNKPIPEETFTYKNLDLKDGDKFTDKIENKEYRYKEATKTLELVVNKD